MNIVINIDLLKRLDIFDEWICEWMGIYCWYIVVDDEWILDLVVYVVNVVFSDVGL